MPLMALCSMRFSRSCPWKSFRWLKRAAQCFVQFILGRLILTMIFHEKMKTAKKLKCTWLLEDEFSTSVICGTSSSTTISPRRRHLLAMGSIVVLSTKQQESKIIILTPSLPPYAGNVPYLRRHTLIISAPLPCSNERAGAKYCTRSK